MTSTPISTTKKKIWTPKMGTFPTWAMMNKPYDDYDWFQNANGQFTGNVVDYLSSDTHSFATSNINPLTENITRNRVNIIKDSGDYARLGAKVNNAHYMAHAWGAPARSHPAWANNDQRTRMPRVYGFESEYRWPVDGNNRTGTYTYISEVWMRFYKPPSTEYDFRLTLSSASPTDPKLYPTYPDQYGDKRGDDWKKCKWEVSLNAKSFIISQNLYLKSVMIQQEFQSMSGIATEKRSMDWRKMNFMFAQSGNEVPVIYQHTQRAWAPDPLYDLPLRPFLV